MKKGTDQAKDGDKIRQKVDVNGWRTIYLVNEFNELQTYRLIRTDVTLILYALFMEGFGFKHWITHDPDLNLFNTDSPKNYTLFFFVTTLLIFAIGILQYALSYAIKHWKPLRTEDFVDICSICNQSILLFDETYQGYYIHGRSPYGQAEISGEQLRLALEFESCGNAQMRGIIPEDPDMQTFEIFIPPDLLNKYRSEYWTDVKQ